MAQLHLCLICGRDNLEDVVQWARSNDGRCREIADNSTALAEAYLTDAAGRAYFTETLRTLTRIRAGRAG